MVTRIALEHDVHALPERVVACLTDRDVMLRRLALEPAMQARLTQFFGAADATPGTQLALAETSAQLPASWLPPGVPAGYTITRLDRWWAVADGADGELTLTVTGMPVRCSGPLGLRAWRDGSVLSMTLDLQVDLPFVGASVERMVRDRMEPAMAAELALIADEAVRDA